jgi:N-methylhydantoinase A
MYRIGIDVGGTFTDFVVDDVASGQTHFYKVSSTPDDPSRAILDGLRQVIGLFALDPARIEYVGHGTTVATNMIIECKGAKTALVTTAGFRDVLAIGRQNRPALYDMTTPRVPPLVDRHWRCEVRERLTANGDVLTELDERGLEAILDRLQAEGVESIAIAFLHSYRNDTHERRAARIAAERCPSAYVSTSSSVLPEFREYERTSTTVMNSYVGPKMGDYFDRLNTDIRELGIAVPPLTIHSNGGLLPIDTAKRLPVATCLSGPAAGVIGAATIAAASGFGDVVTFDVGGTSTDVSLITGGCPSFTEMRSVAGHPVRLPMIDIHVVGAGGGSIAYVDGAGGMKVGPDSAGSYPGPVAYGRGGTRPTLTDANVFLKRLNPVSLLGGRLPVEYAAAGRAIDDHVARPLGISTQDAAYGIIQVAAANMARAVRSVTTEQGYDLARLALLAFGGAGPLHACDIAREAGIGAVLIPKEPGTMCARGALLSDISLDFVRTSLLPATTSNWSTISTMLQAMMAEGEGWLAREQVPPSMRRFDAFVKAHYQGQSHEIRVPVDLERIADLDVFLEKFAAVHDGNFGYSLPNRPVVVASCVVRAIGAVTRTISAVQPVSSSLAQARLETRDVYFGGSVGWLPTAVYARHAIPFEHEIHGPAIIEEMSSTTVILEGQKAVVDVFGHIVVRN